MPKTVEHQPKSPIEKRFSSSSSSSSDSESEDPPPYKECLELRPSMKRFSRLQSKDEAKMALEYYLADRCCFSSRFYWINPMRKIKIKKTQAHDIYRFTLVTISE